MAEEAEAETAAARAAAAWVVAAIGRDEVVLCDFLVCGWDRFTSTAPPVCKTGEQKNRYSSIIFVRLSTLQSQEKVASGGCARTPVRCRGWKRGLVAGS